MTPAINAAKHAKIDFKIHQYTHDPTITAYGTEAAEKMGVPEHQVFKTLVVSLDRRELAVAIVPVSSLLNMKQMAKAAGAKKAAMATASEVERSTGYVLGGVSPLGQKKKLKTIIDASAKGFEQIYVSAGKRGVDMSLSPADLAKLTRGLFAELCQ